MKPWETVERTKAPDGTELVLARRGDEWVVRVAGRTLMSSRVHGSEEALAAIALGAPPHAAPCSSAGSGSGTRCARPSTGSRPTRASSSWSSSPGSSRGTGARSRSSPGAPSTTRACASSRETSLQRISEAKGAYDAILLDVDNGPSALAHASNAALYGVRGVRACADALRAGGVLAVWSAGPDERYRERLERVGLEVTVETVTARGDAGGVRHVVVLGAKPEAGVRRLTPPRPGAAGSSRAGGTSGRGSGGRAAPRGAPGPRAPRPRTRRG